MLADFVMCKGACVAQGRPVLDVALAGRARRKGAKIEEDLIPRDFGFDQLALLARASERHPPWGWGDHI